MDISTINNRNLDTLSEHEKEVLLSPLFIVGAPRSGTTWLQRLVVELDGVVSGQESEFFYMFNQPFETIEKPPEISRPVGLSYYWDIDVFYEEMRGIWMKTFMPLLRHKQTVQLLLEKTPGHVLYLDRMAKFLPNARFIHLIRDSRAVSASVIAASKGWGGHWAASNAKKAAIEWWRLVTAGRTSVISGDPARYLEIHYEDMHEDTVKALKRVADFAGLDCSQTDLETAVARQAFNKQKKAGGTNVVDAKGGVLKEPEGFFRKGKVDSWKSDLGPIQKLVIWRYTRNLMRECGYSWEGRLR